MKQTLFLLLSAILVAGAVQPVRAQVNVGVTADENGLRSFYLGIGEYFHVPEREVVVVRERGIPDDDLPVVYFLADRTHVAPATIVDLRLRGWSWDQITFYLGLGPEIYYVPVPYESIGPPYGRAYGHFHKVPRARWRTIHLSDDDVVNLVNLRFVSEYQHIPPQRVMEMRGHDRRFTDVYVKAHRGEGGQGRGERGGSATMKESGGKGHGKHKK